MQGREKRARLLARAHVFWALYLGGRQTGASGGAEGLMSATIVWLPAKSVLAMPNARIE
jgi:hypothetical protein